MKKNILIIVLFILLVFTFLYAFVKADEASKERIAAEMARNEAVANAEEAKLQQELALDAAAEARMRQAEAEQLQMELEKCKTR